MILVLAGTTEAWEAIRALAQQGLEVAATVVTGYGAELATAAGATRVWVGPLDDSGFRRLLEELKPRAVVDATHPFAVEISERAQSACRQLGVPLFRYVRPPGRLPAHPLVVTVRDTEEAALAAVTGGTLLLAVGSRRLAELVRHPALRQKRLVVRILPDPRSLRLCLDLGIPPRDIVALQGPFSTDLNRALLRHYGADVLVTKESGSPGGLEQKIEAALAEGVKVVVIRRPREEEGEELGKIVNACKLLSGGGASETRDCSPGAR